MLRVAARRGRDDHGAGTAVDHLGLLAGPWVAHGHGAGGAGLDRGGGQGAALDLDIYLRPAPDVDGARGVPAGRPGRGEAYGPVVVGSQRLVQRDGDIGCLLDVGLVDGSWGSTRPARRCRPGTSRWRRPGPRRPGSPCPGGRRRSSRRSSPGWLRLRPGVVGPVGQRGQVVAVDDGAVADHAVGPDRLQADVLLVVDGGAMGW